MHRGWQGPITATVPNKVIAMTQRTGNIIFSAILIITAIYLLHMAVGFGGAAAVAGSELGSGFFPIAILSFIIICCLINIVQNIRRKGASSKEAARINLDKTQFIRVTLAFLTCIVSYFIWERFGFMVMSTFFIIALSIVLSTRSVKILIFLLLFGPAVYVIFDKALLITLQ